VEVEAEPRHLPLKSDSSFWNHLPAIQFSSADLKSKFSGSEEEAGKDVETGRRLEQGQDGKLRLVGGAKAELVGEHPNLRFKGDAKKQKESRGPASFDA
jgi:hypothetical protein